MRRALPIAAMLIAITLLLVVSGARPTSAQVAAEFSGEVPPPGSMGLLVTTTFMYPAQLESPLRIAGCEPVTIAMMWDGAWRVHVVGAPAAVNTTTFPGGMGETTPFLVRCRGKSLATPVTEPLGLGCPERPIPPLAVDGTVVIKCYSGTMLVVEASTGTVTQVLRSTSRSTTNSDFAFDLSPNSQWLSEIDASGDNLLYVKATTSGDRLRVSGQIDQGPYVAGPFSPDSRSLLYTRCCTGDLTVADLEAATARQLDTGGCPYVTRPVWSPSGEAVAFLCQESEVNIVGADGRGLRVVLHQRRGLYPQLLAWPTEGQLVALVVPSPVGSARIAVAVIDPTTLQTREIPIAADQPVVSPECIAASPDGSGVLYSRWAGESAFDGRRSIRYLNLTTGLDIEWFGEEILSFGNQICPLRWLR